MCCTQLCFADNTVLISEEEKDLEASLKKMGQLLMEMCNIKINKTKMKIMNCIWDEYQTSNVWLDGERSTHVKHFRYLENLISCDGRRKKRSTSKLFRPKKRSIRRKIY